MGTTSSPIPFLVAHAQCIPEAHHSLRTQTLTKTFGEQQDEDPDRRQDMLLSAAYGVFDDHTSIWMLEGKPTVLSDVQGMRTQTATLTIREPMDEDPER